MLLRSSEGPNILPRHLQKMKLELVAMSGTLDESDRMKGLQSVVLQVSFILSHVVDAFGSGSLMIWIEFNKMVCQMNHWDNFCITVQLELSNPTWAPQDSIKLFQRFWILTVQQSFEWHWITCGALVPKTNPAVFWAILCGNTSWQSAKCDTQLGKIPQTHHQSTSSKGPLPTNYPQCRFIQRWMQISLCYAPSETATILVQSITAGNAGAHLQSLKSTSVATWRCSVEETQTMPSGGYPNSI